MGGVPTKCLGMREGSGPLLDEVRRESCQGNALGIIQNYDFECTRASGEVGRDSRELKYAVSGSLGVYSASGLQRGKVRKTG